ncbi:uncharacterized protein [Parasteatoda tepidariorum]|uniref:uncharacterized protein isoform X1 n=2 Tax=Parasteatoda tepidariorum TaxID=114398 RepID=UPI001C71F1D8|nr:uncharacterized protein LOC107456197 isoform X1 [Parasteatoda tepidariorum]
MFDQTVLVTGESVQNFSQDSIYNTCTYKLFKMLGAVSRRRRFVFLIIFCCLSYLVFSLYIKRDIPSNLSVVTEINEDTTFIDHQDIENKKSEKEADDTKNIPESKIVLPNEDTTNTEESEIDRKKKLLRLQQFRKAKVPPEDLFFKSRVTFPEDAVSGPTDDDNDIQQIKGLIHKAVTEPYHSTKDAQSVNDIEVQSVPAVTDGGVTKAPPEQAGTTGPVPKSREKLSPTEVSHISSTDALPAVDPTKNPALIIDTSGCKVPKLDPYDPTVAHLISLKGEYICSDIPLFMTPQPNGIIHLNVSILKQYYNSTPDDIQCWYQAILRKHEEPGNVRENDYRTTKVAELEFDKPLKHEYIAARCYFSNNYTHEQYLPLVKLKTEVEEERSKIKPPSPLNVILLGIDSVSKLNFIRHFLKTKAFLKDKMKPFEMKGYTKVGDNTFPNLVPMLTGHFVEYYWNESVRDTFLFDNISLIWKDYARNGFRTFYAEDSPFSGTFNYIKRGFHDPPTDYYYRPLALAIDQSDLRKQAKNAHLDDCLNAELETDLMYDYLKNFVKTMDKRPYWAFCMVSTLTHDYLNSASYADPPATRILQILSDIGALNNSALVIFSDHGLRFGAIRHTYVGKFEERMPFMYIHFPTWFLKQHPEFERNLKINQERLITLFDLHRTMKHLLHLDSKMDREPEEHGLSLLEKIPENRTCADANILEHWCPCNNFEKVNVSDIMVVNASQTIVNHINELLLPHAEICETLEVAEVTDARLGLPNKVVLKFERHENVVVNRTVVLGEAPPTLGDYLLTLTVKPGGAIFEGTVRYDAEHSAFKVMGISRINMYGKTSWCINSQKLKLYCYCKVQQT